MEDKKYNLVLRVRDLQKCRTFYKEKLLLGSPVLDSPFWVEFQMCSGGKLCLEHADPATEISADNNGPVWMMEADEDLVEQLTASGYLLPEQKTPQILGYSVKAFRDPEGNIFYLTLNEKD